MDERWYTHVFAILPALAEVLIPDLALLERLYCGGVITLGELQKLFLDDNNAKRSRMLLVSILPRRGPDSFDRFLSVLKETEGQEHVAQLILKTRKKPERRRTVRVEKRGERRCNQVFV